MRSERLNGLLTARNDRKIPVSSIRDDQANFISSDHFSKDIHLFGIYLKYLFKKWKKAEKYETIISNLQSGYKVVLARLIISLLDNQITNALRQI